MLDPWSRTLGESTQFWQCISTGDADMSTINRWITFCRSDGLPYSTSSRSRIPSYTSDADVSTVRSSRWNNEPVIHWLCIALSYPLRMCGYATVPYEPTQSSTRRIPTSQIRSQSSNNQGDFPSMSDLSAVWKMHQRQCQLVTGHFRTQSHAAAV